MNLSCRRYAVIFAVLAAIASSPPSLRGIALGEEKKVTTCVAEWERAPADSTRLPALTTAQMRAEFEKTAAAMAGVASWEARCRVTSKVGRAEDTLRDMAASGKAPDFIAETHSTLMVSNGKQWLFERRLGDWQQGKTDYRSLFDGELVQTLLTADMAMIETPPQFAKNHWPGVVRPESPPGFPPFLETAREHCQPIPGSLPDVPAILADPAARVLPWAARVGSHACYVVERKKVVEDPIFGSEEEFQAWRKTHPNAIRYVGLNAAPGARFVLESTDRVALDPQTGFMPARWACGRRHVRPGFTVERTGKAVPPGDITLFPAEEIVCTKFRDFGGRAYVAGRFEYSRYATDAEGHHRTTECRTVALEDFQVGRKYPPDFFHAHWPSGCFVDDNIREIVYSAGDSEEKIAAMVAIAKAKKAFLAELKKKLAPPLDGALWLNSKPIRLEDLRGKRIQLYFISRPPAGLDLSRLQKDWSRHSPNPADESYDVLIAVHPYVEGDDLERLKDEVRQRGITLPVMVDSRAPGDTVPGKAYASYGIPAWMEHREVLIDKTGHVSHHGSEEEFVNWQDLSAGMKIWRSEQRDKPN